MYIIALYNQSVSIIYLAPHITYVVCVNFTHRWRDQELKKDFKQQILGKALYANFIHFISEFLPEICWGAVAQQVFLNAY